MTANYLKYLMAEAGLKQFKIAKALEMKRQVVSAVVNGDDRAKRVEVYISSRLGLPSSDIWPLEKTPVPAQQTKPDQSGYQIAGSKSTG